MTTLLAKLQAAADKRRAALAAKGKYEYSGSLVTLTGGNPLEGKPPSDGTTTALNVGITVENVSEKAVAYSAGVLMSGDIRVAGISRLTVPESLITDLKTVWVISGPAVAGRYSAVGGLIRREDTEWIVVLRRLVQ